MAAVQAMGRFQWTPAFRIARNSSLAAASSLGKLPRVLMTFRRLPNHRLTGLVDPR